MVPTTDSGKLLRLAIDKLTEKQRAKNESLP
jgi:hypothetical protein